MKIDTQVKLLKYRRTKIVATVGTVSSGEDIVKKLITAGVDTLFLSQAAGNPLAQIKGQ